MAPKLIFLLNVCCKKPHYNMLLLITRSATTDPRDNVIIRLTCISVMCEDNGKFILREINSAVLMKQCVSK